MAIKMLVVMTTLPSDNEQTGVSPRTATGAATTISREYPELGQFAKAIFILDVTAVSGTTPTLDVKIQGFNPVSGRWHDVATIPQQTAVTSTALAPVAVNLDFQLYRAQWTVAGTATPSFTFSLAAIVHTEEPVTRTW